MARAAIKWTREDLSSASGVSLATIRDFETTRRQPYERTLRELRAAFEGVGISFLKEGDSATGPGVSYNPDFVITE